jgi:LAO/AO transport system kinase
MLVDGPPDARRRALATAITLVESCRDEDRARQETLLTSILPWTGDAVRLGVSGPPGAGKSSLIDVLGTYLLEHRDVRVAVLAIDPSSTRSGGSILGDKTRMERLAARPGAFIRPSPSGGAAGGVAPATREAILLCEAAGYHVVIVETVGSGQGEIAVSTMTDVFAVVQPPFSGDGLQAVKRGMMEAADLLVVTKTDIDPQAAATAMLELSATLAATRAVPPPVLGFTTVSAEASGCAASMWEAVDTLHAASRADGRLAERRAGQQAAWMWERIEAGLRRQFVDDPRVAAALPAMLDAVRAGSTTPTAAAATLLELVRHRP